MHEYKIIPRSFNELRDMVTDYYNKHPRGNNDGLDIMFSQLCLMAVPPPKVKDKYMS